MDMDFQFLRDDAQAGDAYAQFILGNHYYYGSDCVKLDYEQA